MWCSLEFARVIKCQSLECYEMSQSCQHVKSINLFHLICVLQVHYFFFLVHILWCGFFMFVISHFGCKQMQKHFEEAIYALKICDWRYYKSCRYCWLWQLKMYCNYTSQRGDGYWEGVISPRLEHWWCAHYRLDTN